MEATVSVNPQGNKISLSEHFSKLQDPRRQNKNMRHNLIDIIVIAICAVIANANDWNEIELWARLAENVSCSSHMRQR